MTNVLYNYNQLFNVMLFHIDIFSIHTLYQCYCTETILLEKSIKKHINYSFVSNTSGISACVSYFVAGNR